MKEDILKEVLLKQRKPLERELIRRDKSKDLISFAKTPFIVLLSGIRRCGKSTLLKQDFFENSYYVNFDDERFIDFSVRDFSKMYEALKELFGEKKYFIFDEIQNIKGWERFVRRLHDEGNKIFVTGSNATLLSKELGTHLTGRNITAELYPFSFNEFLRFKNINFNIKKLVSEDRAKIKRSFNEYISKGGFPDFLKTEKEEYLKSLYENILYRDIISRYNIQSERQIKEVVYHSISNIGKEISFNSIKKIVGVSNPTTIRDFFHYLNNSYLLFLIRRYNSSLKKQIQVPKKVYCIDTGIASYLGFRPSQDTGRLLENLVFLQLKRGTGDIYYHKEEHECDFIIKEGINIKKAIQVCYEINENNKQRELAGLIDACKTYDLKQGLLLTYDQEDEFKKENIKITMKPIWKWLLE